MVSQIPVETLKVMTAMSDSGVQYFEGVEKLLEIWFTSDDNTNKDLRKIPRLELLEIAGVDCVNCRFFLSAETSWSRC